MSTLSASDIRPLYQELEAAGSTKGALLKALGDMTVRQFLTRNSPTDAYPSPAICVAKDASLLEAAQYMVKHHIHRVWIVTNGDGGGEGGGLQGVGVGCLSFTDIIRAVLNYVHKMDLPT